jgi:hypothetical protein
MTVLEGGAFGLECIVTLCRVGDEVVLMLVVSVVWRGSSGGLSSSLLECPMFSPPIALTVFSLQLWLEVVPSWLGGVVWALPMLYQF